MSLLRDRVSSGLGRDRGPEWRQPRFFVFDYPYWQGGLLVRINRRGPNGGTWEATRREVEYLLDRARRVGVTSRQLDAVRLEVRRALAVPPFDGETNKIPQTTSVKKVFI